MKKILVSNQKMEIDLVNATVSFNDLERTSLTAVELKILLCLMEEGGRLTSYNKLYKQVWGWPCNDNNSILNTNIYRIRQKIGKEKIKGVRGVGYYLDV